MEKITVKNRSGGTVIYRIPESNIRREFMPNEAKSIDKKELEALSFQPGGRELIADYLLIEDEAVLLEYTGQTPEPEYWMTEKDIEVLMKTGSLDAFKDCLDFAPQGVKDMVIKLSTSLPLNDSAKRQAIKDILHFDVSKALQHIEEEKQDDKSSQTTTSGRRVQPAATESPERRTSSKYNVVNRKVD